MLGKIRSFYLSDVFIHAPFRFHLKTGASLHPLFRLNLPVPVQVGTQVAMSANAATGIVTEQCKNEYPHGMNLPLGTCIRRAPVTVKPTLIADADTAQVVSLCVRANPFNRTGRLYIPILADIEMVTCPVEATPAMAHFQIIFREIPVRPGGGTVDHNQVNLSHRPVLSLLLSFLFLRKKNRTSNTMSKILSIISLHF